MELGKKVNINVQGNEDTHVDVNILLGKSYQYNDLLDQLNTQQKLFDRTPEDEIDERLSISKKINDLKDLIEQFKKDILQLAEAFQNIEINTERLIKAKEFFDKGELGEARAVLETELEQMQNEQAHLLREKEHFEKDVLPALMNNAEEFYLLAMATQTDYQNPNRFEDTCKYFETSIKSKETKDNLFRYAHFLHEHNQFPKAENYYSQYLDKFADDISLEEKAVILNNLAVLHVNQYDYEKALYECKEALEFYRKLAEYNPQTFLPYVADTLNNLAVLHKNQNEYVLASNEYEEALEIYRKLGENNSQTYLSDVAMTLNNLAILHWNQDEYEKALYKCEEALEIYRKLAENNSQIFLSNVAMTLNSLAVLHRNQNEYVKATNEYEEALKIYQKLTKDNPQTFLPDVAMILNNLAILHDDKNEYEKASNEYQEALAIRRNLYEQMPNTYTPSLANTLINLADFYQKSLPEREKSLEYVIEAVVLLLPIVETVPFTQRYMQSAINVLRDWNLSDEEIERLIEEKKKEVGNDKSKS